MVIRQSNENNLPGSQLRGSQFSWCADGLSEKHWALPGVLLLYWLLICAQEISVCVNALYDGRGKCQREKYCVWIWSGKGKTSTIVSWISFMVFVIERHPVNIHYFTSCCQYRNIWLKQAVFEVISYMMCVRFVYIVWFSSTPRFTCSSRMFFFSLICYT